MEKSAKLIATLIIVSIICVIIAVYEVGINPIVIIIPGAVILMFVIFSYLNKRISGFNAPVVPDKYRPYLAILLTIISILSILPLSQKVIETPLGYPLSPSSSLQLEKHSPILPPVIVVSALTIFVAVTTYMRKFYPQSIIFALAMIGVVYITIPMAPVMMFIIPVLVIASALWHDDKDMIYPVACSAVLGIIAGVEVPTSYIGWDMSGLVFLTLGITVLSGIITVVLFLFRSKLPDDFNTTLRATLSLIVFFIVMSLAYSRIFQPFYNPYGWVSN